MKNTNELKLMARLEKTPFGASLGQFNARTKEVTIYCGSIWRWKKNYNSFTKELASSLSHEYIHCFIQSEIDSGLEIKNGCLFTSMEWITRKTNSDSMNELSLVSYAVSDGKLQMADLLRKSYMSLKRVFYVINLVYIIFLSWLIIQIIR